MGTGCEFYTSDDLSDVSSSQTSGLVNTGKVFLCYLNFNLPSPMLSNTSLNFFPFQDQMARNPSAIVMFITGNTLD